ncbi:hypothetical protein [Paramicrobacterium chengjingii]|uniref:4-hydroxy-tetrahydrodipicolinate synthase n=1 Tax=Paramicrobacterium chengjingii TaxID=2769067 RepID=A0ABX6YLC5_9MICO|nr:hypothetical protein [Microbacterium chengjingii]QPZ39576.1 hypothetical protein HCR76_05840 [Microbacterium chengjingii]
MNEFTGLSAFPPLTPFKNDAVTERTELPVIVYDNSGTTNFSFTVDLAKVVNELGVG